MPYERLLLVTMLRLIPMCVWDRNGRLYAPIIGYAGEVVAYGTQDQANHAMEMYCRENCTG